jgi:1-acyl-sn-glycerol-3-phosphate acyltransferase
MARSSTPDVPPALPRRGWGWGRALGRLILRIARWGFEGEIPNLSKGVIIVAPHTSNWDFVIGAAGMLVLDLELCYLGKHTLFAGPLGPMFRALGGIPIDRSQPGSGVVEEMAARFEQHDKLLLALAPEGTRKAVARWKTGFHRIARAAGVPIFAVTLDYGSRRICFGPLVTPSEDLEGDLRIFYDFFSAARGKRGQVAPTG